MNADLRDYLSPPDLDSSVGSFSPLGGLGPQCSPHSVEAQATFFDYDPVGVNLPDWMVLYNVLVDCPGATRQDLSSWTAYPINVVCRAVRGLLDAGMICEDGVVVNDVTGKKNKCLWVV